MEDSTMPRRKHTPEQIIRKLAEGNKLLAQGQSVEEVCRALAISESSWHRWLAQYVVMKASDAKRLKELERGAPAFVRFDNGPEFVAHAVEDWCPSTARFAVNRPRLDCAAHLDSARRQRSGWRGRLRDNNQHSHRSWTGYQGR
jgi:Transposase